jgi:hypothetical protein
MAATYACDHCGVTTPDPTDWLIVAVHFMFTNPGVRQAPGGRTLQASAPDLLFDTIECRQAWCEQAGVTDPGPLATGLRGAAP